MMNMTKEDYIALIKYSVTSPTCKKGLLELIEEHFELDQNFNILEKNYDELYDMVYDPKPYKFEDLKPDMWVWDDVEKKCNKIIDINENNEIGFYYVTESPSRYIVNFEENRFYPVTKALCEVNER